MLTGKMNFLVIVLTLVGITHGLMGYDCNGDHLNVTTISLNSIGDCDMQPIPGKIGKRTFNCHSYQNLNSSM
jgi:hypothetical protein